jgi:aryl-alcohol dehydrogenase-like predicted oxidoreductase
MEMRQLGTEGPRISVVGYGAWEAGGTDWGANESDEDVVASMRAVFDAGMNWIDTAEVYGKGRSEELVARAVAGRRDEALIFTKVAPDEEGTGLRPEEIRRAIRGSLRRLGVDHVDLYQVHWPDPRIPLGDTWGTMAELVSEGLTRWIGLSNFGRDDVEWCAEIHRVTSVQNEFSLLRRDDRLELLPWLAEHEVGYLAYGPLAFGLLTGAIGADTRFAEGDWRAEQCAGGGTEGEGFFSPGAFERNLEVVEALRPVAERADMPLSTLALRWALEQHGVTATIAGTRNASHVRSNARAGDVRLQVDVLEEIDAIVGRREA